MFTFLGENTIYLAIIHCQFVGILEGEIISAKEIELKKNVFWSFGCRVEGPM